MSYLLRNIILLLLVIIPGFIHAQEDPYQRPLLKNPGQEAIHYEEMAAWFCKTPQFNLDSSYYYYSEWEKLLLKQTRLNYKQLTKVNVEWAKNYKIFQFFNKAKAKAIRALEFYEKIPQSQWDVHLGAELYYVLSICYLKNGEEKKALHCFFKQDSMLCDKEDELSIAMYLQHKADFNLGYSKGDKKISEKLFNQSLPLLKKQKHYVTIARNYMILANMYKTENRIPEYNIMRDSLQKYADISRNPYLKPYNLLEDSYEQIINGNYNRARNEIHKVLAEMRKYGLDKTNFYQSAVQDLGEIEWKNKNYDLSAKYYIECLEIAKSLEMVDMQLSLLEILSYIYHDKGDHKTAFSYLEQYKNLNQQNQQERADRSTAEHELEIALSNKELQLEKNRTFSNNLLGAFFIMIVGIGFGFYNYLKQRKTNALLENNIQQKEVLLKEIHHRVKNNLTVISGLLELQSYSLKDETIEQTFRESQNRVKSIALIHQRLYQDEDLSSIELKEYVNELYKQIQHVFNKVNQKVTFTNKIEKTFLDIDTAVSLGLIINELFTNSFKYAFNTKSMGEITIQLFTKAEGTYQLIYTDNGKGLPDGFDFKNVNSFGLRLVSRLCKQLFGKIVYQRSQGYPEFIIDFKDKAGKFKSEQEHL